MRPTLPLRSCSSQTEFSATSQLLRPLPTPPSSSKSSYRPLPAIPSSSSVCGTPKQKQKSASADNYHSEAKSYCDLDLGDTISGRVSPSGGQELSQIPTPLRPGSSGAIDLTCEQNKHSPQDAPPDQSHTFFFAPEARGKSKAAIADRHQPAIDSSNTLKPSTKQQARPQLQIQIQPPKRQPLNRPPALILPRRSSLDSLTERSPSLVSPEQALSPVVSRRRRKSCQPASSLMILSLAIQEVNSHDVRMQILPDTVLPSGKIIPLHDDVAEDDFVSLVRSPLISNLRDSLKFSLETEDDSTKLHHFRLPVWKSFSTPSFSDDNLSVRAKNVTGGDCLPINSHEGDGETKQSENQSAKSSLRDLDASWIPFRDQKGLTIGKAAKKPLRAMSPAEVLAEHTAVVARERRRRPRATSRIWYREKGGKRWEERDLEHVLTKLRKL